MDMNQNIQKNMHFILDGREIGTTVTSVSGRQQSFAIPQQSHGAHSFTVYFGASGLPIEIVEQNKGIKIKLGDIKVIS